MTYVGRTQYRFDDALIQHRHLEYICANVLGVIGSNGLHDTLWIVPIKSVITAL